MTDFGPAFGQDLLEEALQKLGYWKSKALGLLGAVVAVTEGDVTVFQPFQAGVSNGHPKDIAPQIFQDLLATTSVLSMHHPVFIPGCGGHVLQLVGGLESGRAPWL